MPITRAGPPLFPSARERATLNEGDLIMTNQEERRRHPRVAIDWPVVIITKRGATVGNARNISVRGALILSEEPLRPRDRSRLFLVPPDRLAFRVSFEVAWLATEGSAQGASDYSMGLRFIRMSRGDGEFVLNFVQHHLTLHRMRRR
jgi:PilZ domain